MKTIKDLSKVLSVSLITIALFSGCSDSPINTDNDQGSDFDAAAMLQNEAENVILQTYVDLDSEAGDLVSAVEALKENATQANLDAAQTQWQETRKPWENSESFLFGPVANKGVDPAIDSWPLNKTDLNNVLGNGDPLSKSYVDVLENNLKGFHTIEYLLFGDSSSKAPGDFTAREFEYLLAATRSFKAETKKLAMAWKPSGDNYMQQLAEAGNSSSNVYQTQKSALEELITGMEIIADEVANGKIDDPYSQEDTSLVESQFSFNSKKDFKNNLRSISNVYTGDYNGHKGEGITDFISKQDDKLDSRFKNEIDAAIQAIDDIPGNFRDAISSNRIDVANAQEKVRTVLSTIQEDIKPLKNEL